MISIVIPIYNDEKISEIVSEAKECLKDKVEYEIIFVDDKVYGIKPVVREEESYKDNIKFLSRAKKMDFDGAALDGFCLCKGKVVCTIDIRENYCLETILEMLKVIEAGSDVVLARPYKKCFDNIPFISKRINNFSLGKSKMFMMKREVIDGIEFNPAMKKALMQVLLFGRYKKVTEISLKSEKKEDKQVNSKNNNKGLSDNFSKFIADETNRCIYATVLMLINCLAVDIIVYTSLHSLFNLDTFISAITSGFVAAILCAVLNSLFSKKANSKTDKAISLIAYIMMVLFSVVLKELTFLLFINIQFEPFFINLIGSTIANVLFVVFCKKILTKLKIEEEI